jgi:hydrogenase maturation protease
VTNKTRRCIVLGLGNPDRGDDAAGRVVARRLRDTLPIDVVVAEHGGEATEVFTEIDRADAVFVIDACVSGAPPGAIHRFDANAAPLPDFAFGLSTHGFGLGMAIELARTVGRLPPLCIVYAVEGGSFEPGAPLSAAVNAAIDEIARRLRAEVADWLERPARHK